MFPFKSNPLRERRKYYHVSGVFVRKFPFSPFSLPWKGSYTFLIVKFRAPPPPSFSPPPPSPISRGGGGISCFSETKLIRHTDRNTRTDIGLLFYLLLSSVIFQTDSFYFCFNIIPHCNLQEDLPRGKFAA